MVVFPGLPAEHADIIWSAEEQVMSAALESMSVFGPMNRDIFPIDVR
jgi:hypothetical protein